MSYNLVLRSEQTGVFINISLNADETKVVLGPNHGLENNQKYTYTVSAMNNFGMMTSNQNERRRYFCENNSFHDVIILYAYQVHLMQLH